MSFRIPTLDEARRKRERQTVTKVASPSPSSRSPALSGGSGGSAKRGASSGSRATSTAASASTSVRGANVVGSAATGGAGAGGIPPRHGRPAAATVLNPYAKKRRQASSTSASGSQPPSSVAPNSRRTTNSSIPPTKAAMGHAHRHGKSAATSSSSLPEPPPPVVDVGPSATFSQAFGSLEDTRQYETEVETLRRTNADVGPPSGHEREKERAQQRTVDAEAAAAVAASSSAAGGSSAVMDDARANQATLQPHVLHVSTRQRGNGVLRHVRNVPLAYSNIVPDYILGANRCALFLSLRYHGIHPNYVHRRIKELGRDFDLRVLLCLVDVEDNASALLVLNKLCVANDLTLILSWSEEEAARYLETFKALESKDASSIQRREKDTYAERVADVLSAVRSVNKTDAAQLLSQFGSLKNLASAPMDELSLCPGIGEKKVRRLFDAFHKPFSSAAAARKRREASERKEAEEEKESAESAALALEAEEEEEEEDGIVV